MRTAVITIAHGRHEHLVTQQRGLLHSGVAADHYVVVAMQDSRLADLMRAGSPVPDVVPLTCDPRRLPLAHARNIGAAHALSGGSELLIFLDADCIPGPDMIANYTRAAGRVRHDSLLMGPVGYLPPSSRSGYELSDLERIAVPHGARPVPGPDEILVGADPCLFWSLSFALTSDCWRRLGGFEESYRGYGGEDTDLGQQANALGIDAAWIGGAWAYHQHHRSQGPPADHVEEILENAARFYSRWGWWPMSGWLEHFRDEGLIQCDELTGQWVLA